MRVGMDLGAGALLGGRASLHAAGPRPSVAIAGWSIHQPLGPMRQTVDVNSRSKRLMSLLHRAGRRPLLSFPYKPAADPPTAELRRPPMGSPRATWPRALSGATRTGASCPLRVGPWAGRAGSIRCSAVMCTFGAAVFAAQLSYAP